MTGPVATRLPGDRLHLQHGPIDLIIGADGARAAAFRAARNRFATILEELAAELPLLRQPVSALTGTTAAPCGETARIMCAATMPHAGFLTPMAAVAGAVAETILRAMVAAAPLARAYVNNGGDIALHLTPGTQFRAAIAGLAGQAHGVATIDASSNIRGIATSGQGGRSLSFGIADSVTVLASHAAGADAVATLIANAVDLPGHPAIRRTPASALHPDSDLGHRPVVTAIGPLTRAEVARALAAGATRARALRDSGLIGAAALFLRGQSHIVGLDALEGRSPAHA